MEIEGIRCNRCPAKAFTDDPDMGMWATILVTVPGIGLERRVHYCPNCFVDWDKGLAPGPARLINTELEKAILQNGQNSAPEWPAPVEMTQGTGEHEVLPPPPIGPPNGGHGGKRGARRQGDG